MKLIHIENKIDPTELFILLQRQRNEAVREVLSIVKREILIEAPETDFQYHPVVKAICSFYHISPHHIS